MDKTPYVLLERINADSQRAFEHGLQQIPIAKRRPIVLVEKLPVAVTNGLRQSGDNPSSSCVGSIQMEQSDHVPGRSTVNTVIENAAGGRQAHVGCGRRLKLTWQANYVRGHLEGTTSSALNRAAEPPASSRCVWSRLTYEMCWHSRLPADRQALPTPLRSVPPPLLLFGAKDSPSVQRRRRVSEDLADVWSTQSEVLRHALRPLAATWTLRVSGSFDLALVAQGSTLDDASGDRMKLRAPAFEAVEKAVFNWFLEIRASGTPVSRALLQQKARNFTCIMGHDDFVASDGWLQRFKERHDIVGRAVSGESLSVDREAAVAGEPSEDLGDVASEGAAGDQAQTSWDALLDAGVVPDCDTFCTYVGRC
ncbi:hypothetical protein HPB49_003939 [Dermacentor silvarum]|uniref:Uncharacterized protein n=1 Tax=Dermacentor silvarum TaxID=543639 RepID=A0ACB8DTS9_DERSI|nr:hypothetical protein HPB49_003939 [Dermacentor silvarum]